MRNFTSEVALEASFGVQRHTVRTEILLAGFWRRLIAWAIDAALLAGIGALVASGVSALTHNDFQALANVGPVTAALAWAYFAVLESSPAQGTLGKLALNLYVTDTHGDPITFRRATFRYLFKSLSTLVAFVGWALAAFTPRKQALHDILAGTLVLRRVHYLVLGREAPVEPGDHWDGAHWVALLPPQEKS